MNTSWKMSGLLAGVVLAACAGTPPANDTDAAKRAASSARADCLRETGSRIKPRDERCVEQPGRSYDREDLDRTGRTNPADALRTLDPAITRP